LKLTEGLIKLKVNNHNRLTMQIKPQQLELIADRWLRRQKERNNHLKNLSNVTKIESPERIQKRLIHLAEVKKQKIPTPYTIIDEIGHERVIGRDDFLGIEFLELGLAVSRSVCKVHIYDSLRGFRGSGTGFLVSPSLMLTNNHVLETAEMAMNSEAEFDYQLDSFGNALPSVKFSLNPSVFFQTNERLDYTLVAVHLVGNNGRKLSEFGWNKLMGEGKALIGDSLNIIQHPNGEHKQIVLQENQLIDLFESFAHYLTDTEPGSSGSIVCNNDWEVVALHHAGVPKKENGRYVNIYGDPWSLGDEIEDLAWVANEGVRISSILSDLQQRNLRIEEEKLLFELFEFEPRNPLELYNITKHKHLSPKKMKSEQHQLSVTIPLKISISIDDMWSTGDSGLSVSSAQGDTIGFDKQDTFERKVVPRMDPNYETRRGYDPKFLGSDTYIPMPEILDTTKTSRMDNGEHVIPYHHFSIVMNKERRLAYFTASNVDGRKERKEPEPGRNYSRDGLGGLTSRDREAWLTDPRIPEQHQLPDRFYNKDRKAFDKGHIVRREDVAWGSTYEQVWQANGDTFHTTNCSPQVNDYNQSRLGGIWGKFENHVLKEAKDEKLIVFAGPDFNRNDRFFDGYDDRGIMRVKIPRSYWKIVVALAGDSVKSFAFRLRQDLRDVDFTREFAVGSNFRRFQLSVSDLEAKLDNIKFPDLLKDTDQM